MSMDNASTDERVNPTQPNTDNPAFSTGSAPDLTPRRAMLAGMAGIAAGALLTRGAKAGPLNPPAGPVTSTGKTLTEVEPRIAINQANTPGNSSSVFRITQPGSYYLTGNVLGEAGKNGIAIEASNVTLDLNGFALIGVPGAARGIVSFGERSNITIRNGHINDWPGNGIDLSASSASRNSVFEALQVLGCGGNGLVLSNNTTARACLSVANSTSGFLVPTNGVLVECCARQNGSAGFTTGNGVALIGCSARANSGSGFSIGSAGTVQGCTAIGNGGLGFSIAQSSTIHESSASDNQLGGFVIGIGGVAIGCSARGNIGNGMLLQGGAMAEQCVTASNSTNGIEAISDNRVVACLCRLNLAAGIRVSGSDCLIERNLITDNATGMLVTVGGNFIAANRCSGNSSVNWNLVSGNVCLIVNAATAGAINGFAGGTAPGSTDPNANFTF